MKWISLAVLSALLAVLSGCGSSECADTNDCDPNDTPTGPTLTALARITPPPTPSETNVPPRLPTATATRRPSTPVPTATQGPPGTATAAAVPGGIRGVVLIGPQCPVVRQGEECPDKPYEARIDIHEGSGTIATVTSGTDGRFEVFLPPGNYTLIARPLSATPIPAPVELVVTVSSGRYTDIVVSMDSGIR